MTITFKKILNQDHVDPESTHREMDHIMVETLQALGYGNAMKVFLDSRRYYA